jgi:NAD(P)-dependent dehydrogenase (short-subunit alcohol dehydrogenase family)
MARVALVTGANSGIGYAIAERLLHDGFALGYATQDTGPEYEEPKQRLDKLGTIHWVSGDLGDPTVPQRLVAETTEALGGFDVLVNNAGLTEAKPALELDADDFDLLFSVDVRGAFLLSRAAARHMREHGGGSIVNITSVHEHIPRPGVRALRLGEGRARDAHALVCTRARLRPDSRERRRAGRDRNRAERGGRRARPGDPARPAR